VVLVLVRASSNRKMPVSQAGATNPGIHA
jgi:hypothetical protein